MERSLVMDVQRALRQREHELRERDAHVMRLERRLAERDVLIDQLRIELDKCRQVLQAATPSPPPSLPQPPAAAGSDAASIAPWRLLGRGDGIGSVEGRLKRMAISAEPLPRSSLSDLKQLKLAKVAKSPQ